jgi:hypothetical protein
MRTPRHVEDEFALMIYDIEYSYGGLPKAQRWRVEQWVKKLCSEPDHPAWRKNRNRYTQLLLSMVQQERLSEPFDKLPSDSKLPPFPIHLTVYLKSHRVRRSTHGVPPAIRSLEENGHDTPKRPAISIGGIHHAVGAIDPRLSADKTRRTAMERKLMGSTTKQQRTHAFYEGNGGSSIHVDGIGSGSGSGLGHEAAASSGSVSWGSSTTRSHSHSKSSRKGQLEATGKVFFNPLGADADITTGDVSGVSGIRSRGTDVHTQPRLTLSQKPTSFFLARSKEMNAQAQANANLSANASAHALRKELEAERSKRMELESRVDAVARHEVNSKRHIAELLEDRHEMQSLLQESLGHSLAGRSLESSAASSEVLGEQQLLLQPEGMTQTSESDRAKENELIEREKHLAARESELNQKYEEVLGAHTALQEWEHELQQKAEKLVSERAPEAEASTATSVAEKREAALAHQRAEQLAEQVELLRTQLHTLNEVRERETIAYEERIEKLLHGLSPNRQPLQAAPAVATPPPESCGDAVSAPPSAKSAGSSFYDFSPNESKDKSIDLDETTTQS